MGMPPATAASNATITPAFSAAANISVPCSANSALLAVTTCLPQAIASKTSAFARLVPPINSTTTSTSGSCTTRLGSALTRIPASANAWSASMLRRLAATTRMAWPARRSISPPLRVNTSMTPCPTLPTPSRPRRRVERMFASIATLETEVVIEIAEIKTKNPSAIAHLTGESTPSSGRSGRSPPTSRPHSAKRPSGNDRAWGS